MVEFGFWQYIYIYEQLGNLANGCAWIFFFMNEVEPFLFLIICQQNIYLVIFLELFHIRCALCFKITLLQFENCMSCLKIACTWRWELGSTFGRLEVQQIVLITFYIYKFIVLLRCKGKFDWWTPKKNWETEYFIHNPSFNFIIRIFLSEMETLYFVKYIQMISPWSYWYVWCIHIKTIHIA